MKLFNFFLVLCTALPALSSQTTSFLKNVKITGPRIDGIEGQINDRLAEATAVRIFSQFNCGMQRVPMNREANPVLFQMTCPSEVAGIVSNHVDYYYPNLLNGYKHELALTNQSGTKKYFIFKILTPSADVTKLVWSAEPSREINVQDILHYVQSRDASTQE